jgi:hypothetical protein
MRTCYAAVLGGCSRRTSREHYISEAVLRDIAAEGSLWMQGSRSVPEKWLPPSAFSAKIMCRRHNSALSGLDAAARSVVAALRDSQTALDGGATPASRSTSGSGTDFERWLLKLSAGLLASGQIQPPGSEAATGLRNHRETLEILFGQRAWPEGWGMYMNISEATPFNAPVLEDGSMAEFGVEPQWAGAELWAMNAWVRSIPIKLCLGKRPPAQQPCSGHPSRSGLLRARPFARFDCMYEPP